MQNATRKRPFMYGLSTCGWCAKAKAWLDENVDGYDLVYVDLLQGKEQSDTMSTLQKRVGRVAFPVIFFGDEVVVGYQPNEYDRLAEKKQK